MTKISDLRFLGRLSVLAGGAGLILLMITTDIQPIWWVLAGIPTGLALLFYAVGRESALDPLVAERQAGPVGRFLRLTLGSLAFYWMIGVSSIPIGFIAYWGFLIAPLVFLLFIGVLELFGLMTRISQTKEWALGSVILVLGLYLLGPGEVKVSIVAFGGASLILSSVFGYAGCELAALPNLVLKKHYVMGCVFFSPLDRLEQKWRTRHDKSLANPDA